MKIIVDIHPVVLEEVIKCISDTFPFMPPWEMNLNVYEGGVSGKQRIYSFNLDSHNFCYWRHNDSYSDTMEGGELHINNLADISKLLSFICDNDSNFRSLNNVYDFANMSYQEMVTAAKTLQFPILVAIQTKKKGIEDIDLNTGKWKDEVTPGIYTSEQYSVMKEDIKPDGTIPVGKLLFEDEYVTPSMEKSNYTAYIYKMMQEKMQQNQTQIVIPKQKNSIDEGTWWKAGGQALQFEPTLKLHMLKNAKIAIPPKIKWTKELDQVMSGESDAKDVYQYYAQTQPEP